MKKVSIIVACYNCENYIDDCMNSLLNQTIGLSQMEIILVNDASLDKTIFKLAEYEHRYQETIVLIPLTENMRQGGARNIGLSYASGEYVLFLDSDDWLTDTALERLYDTAVETGADIVQCTGEHTEQRVKTDWEIATGIPNELVTFDTPEDRKKFLTGDRVIFGGCFKLYRNAFLQEHQFRFAEHIIFEEPPFVYPMFFYAKSIYYLNERLYMIYLNPEGTTRSLCLAEDRKRDHLTASLQVLREVEQRGLLEEYHEEIEFYFVHAYFAESLLMIKSRRFYISTQLLEEMQQTVKTLFPDYAKNKYLQSPGWILTKNLAECIEMKIDDTTIDEFNEQVAKVLKTLIQQGYL